jgi:mono/diheme cytochrome c family protein
MKPIVLAGALFVASVAVSAAQFPAQFEKTQWDAVYTLEQARRGEPLYNEHCASCHAHDMTGGETAPPLAGGVFAANWTELTLGDIFERIRISMPANNPGALTRAQKADVLAYMLYRGGYPTGEMELPQQTEFLKAIGFLAQKPAGK